MTDQLASAGFLAAGEEAEQLMAFAGDDAPALARAVERRLTGEPLAWITGSTVFCGQRIDVESGVYVPRGFSEQLAERAVTLLPPAGTAIDLCTGTGSIARTLGLARPGARVVATDLDPAAVACARTNRVEAVLGDLFDGLPQDLERSVDVVIGVVPYVPSDELVHLQRDTFAFETRLAYDGGEGGLNLLRRVIAEAPRCLRAGGVLLLEVGGDQDRLLRADLERNGYREVRALIVAGHLIVQPTDREEYLRGCVEVITLARATEGCLDFSLSADLVDPRRINIFERWESRAAVETFRGDGPSNDQTTTIVDAEVSEYDIGSSNRR